MSTATKSDKAERGFSYKDFRREEALKAGLSDIEASQFAGDLEQTLHQLWHLVELGATPEQIAALVI